MAVTNVSKDELLAKATELTSDLSDLTSCGSELDSILSSITNCDDINLSGAASKLKSNESSIEEDFTNTIANINEYANLLVEFDVDDYESVVEKETKSTSEDTSTVDGAKAISDATTLTATTTGVSSSTTSSSSSGYRKSSSSSTSGVTTSYVSYDTSSSSSTSGYQQINATSCTIESGDPNIDVSKYHDCVENGFEVTVGNNAYNLSDSDIDLLMAIVAAESDKTYDDALAVITTILNRCESAAWIASHGTDPVAQATAPNQFVVYQHGSYKKYLNGNAPETVQQAVKDALAGVRNHKYLSFRSNGTTSYSNNMISPTGNRYK